MTDLIDLDKVLKTLRDATPEARAEAKKVFTESAGIAVEWFGSGDTPSRDVSDLKSALAAATALEVDLAAKIEAKQRAHDLAMAVFQYAQHLALAAVAAGL